MRRETQKRPEGVDRVKTSYLVEVTPELPTFVITLTGPSVDVKSVRGGAVESSSSSYGCGEQYTVVGGDRDGITLISGAAPGERSIAAYHSADEITWYTSAPACKAAAAKHPGAAAWLGVTTGGC